MGWKSTLDLTREQVLAAIEARLYTASDEALCDVLEALTDNDNHSTCESLSGHNFRIVQE